MPNNINTYIAFDFGTKKIGVAKGNSLIKQASALDTIYYQNLNQIWQSIDKILALWKPKAFVLGIPLLTDGRQQPITKLALAFSESLKTKYHLKVHHIDERLTSIEAKEIVKEQRQFGKKKKTRKGDIDKIAACLILQQWLSSHE